MANRRHDEQIELIRSGPLCGLIGCLVENGGTQSKNISRTKSAGRLPSRSW